MKAVGKLEQNSPMSSVHLKALFPPETKHKKANIRSFPDRTGLCVGHEKDAIGWSESSAGGWHEV